jgi:hypothetical protein
MSWVGDDIATSVGVGGSTVADPCVSGQQNLRPLELARRLLAAAQKRREFAALGLAQFDPIAYIHPCLLLVRGTDEQVNRMAGVFTGQKTSRPSKVSIWRLSTSTRVYTANPRPKPTCRNFSASARLRFTKWC